MVTSFVSVEVQLSKSKETNFGPNRIAADMEGIGELDFWIL